MTSGIQPTTNLTSVSESSEIGNYGDGNVRIIHEREVNEREYDVPREGRELNRRTESECPKRVSCCILILWPGFSGNHQFGHNKATSKDSMPTPNAEEDTNQLQRECSYRCISIPVLSPHLQLSPMSEFATSKQKRSPASKNLIDTVSSIGLYLSSNCQYPISPSHPVPHPAHSRIGGAG